MQRTDSIGGRGRLIIAPDDEIDVDYHIELYVTENGLIDGTGSMSGNAPGLHRAFEGRGALLKLQDGRQVEVGIDRLQLGEASIQLLGAICGP